MLATRKTSGTTSTTTTEAPALPIFSYTTANTQNPVCVLVRGCRAVKPEVDCTDDDLCVPHPQTMVGPNLVVESTEPGCKLTTGTRGAGSRPREAITLWTLGVPDQDTAATARLTASKRHDVWGAYMLLVMDLRSTGSALRQQNRARRHSM